MIAVPSSKKPKKRRPKPEPSLRADMEAHPEKYPGGSYQEAVPGRFQLIFLSRKPSVRKSDSTSEPPTAGSP